MIRNEMEWNLSLIKIFIFNTFLFSKLALNPNSTLHISNSTTLFIFTYSKEVSGYISKSNSPKLHFTGVYLILTFFSCTFLDKDLGEVIISHATV